VLRLGTVGPARAGWHVARAGPWCRQLSTEDHRVLGGRGARQRDGGARAPSRGERYARWWRRSTGRPSGR